MEGVPVGLIWPAALELAARHEGFDPDGVEKLLAAAEGGMLDGLKILQDQERAKHG